MRRRELFELMAAAALTWPLAALAQQSNVATIGVLVRAAPGWERFWRSFPEALRDLGYVDGKNIRFEFRSDQGQMSRLPELAAEPQGLLRSATAPIRSRSPFWRKSSSAEKTKASTSASSHCRERRTRGDLRAGEPGAHRRRHPATKPVDQARRRPCAEISSADGLRPQVVCRSGRAPVLLPQIFRHLSPGRELCRQGPQRCKAGRSAGATANQVRARDQSQDRESPRPHRAAVAADARRRCDRIAHAKATASTATITPGISAPKRAIARAGFAPGKNSA